MRGYACWHKINGEEVGCGKICHSWDITSQFTPKLQRAFPFILFQKSALHKQVLRLVLPGLSKGVSMCFRGPGDKKVVRLEDVENQCHEGPSFDGDANAEEFADWWEKWTGVRSHIARKFLVNSLFDEPATNAHGRPKWYPPQSSEQLPLIIDVAHNGLRQMPIEGDGNCAFCALAHFLPHDKAWNLF